MADGDKPQKLTAADVRAGILRSYPMQEYTVLWEVGNSTGHGCRRHADAVICSLWPSRGNHLTGVEIKVSRSDLKAELGNPKKADEIARFCDYWVLATPPGLVDVKRDLPPTWGLSELQPTGFMKMIVRPALNEHVESSRGFMAALLRAHAKPDALDVEALRRSIERAARAEKREHRSFDPTMPRDLMKREDAVTEAEARLEEIKVKTGIDLRGYSPAKDWVAAIQLVKKAKHKYVLEALLKLIEDTELRSNVRVALGQTP